MTSTGEARRIGRILTFITLLLSITVVTACAGSAAHRRLSHRAPGDPYLWLRAGLVESNPRVVMVDGLPRVTYPGVEQPQENAVTIAQYGLAHYSSGHPVRALRAADWLVEHQGGRGAWRYRFDFYVESADETLRGPWVSAMAQGQAMSLLVRAWRLTGDRTYLRAAHRALRPLRTPVRLGGVHRTWHGHPFFEEYPTKQRRSLVFNGFIFTILGVRDLAKTGDPLAKRLWRNSEQTAAVIIPEYSYGEHDSVYGLGFQQPGGPRPFPVAAAHSVYAKIHVDLARVMYRLTGRPIYERMAERWAGAL